MNDDFRQEFQDLNRFRGVGEDPVYHPPVITDQRREWPLNRWADAPRDLGFDEFSHYHWRGLRLLKEPATQSAYHDLMWEVRPRTIVELGVYSGGSLVWFRDVAKLIGLDCRVIGIDKNLSLCQIPPTEMTDIALHEADCANVESLEPLRTARHPLIVVDDAHCNTFNVMKWAVDHLLAEGDYFIVEDMIPYWHRYSPNLLVEYLAAFHGVLTMDMMYANSCPQLDRGVFRRSVVEEQGPHFQGRS